MENNLVTEKKTVEVFDSMCGSNNDEIRSLMSTVTTHLDAAEENNKDNETNENNENNSWKSSLKKTPQQENCFDCGPFVCCFMHCVTENIQIEFNQHHVSACRNAIGLGIWRGNVCGHMELTIGNSHPAALAERKCHNVNTRRF